MKTSLFTNKLKPGILALVIFALGLLSIGKANAACKAAFKDSVVGETVYFTSTSTSSYTSYVLNWHFGDATSGSGATTHHTYGAYATTYTVCLYIYDSIHSCSNDTCINVTTGPAPCKAAANFYTINDSGGTVSFVNYSSTSSGHFSSSWDFNDGKTGSSLKSPTHTYTKNGVYHVCLYVVDSTNTSCNSSICHYDTVKNATSCYAYFAHSQTGAHVSTSNGSTTKYGFTSSWVWGDGSANSTSKSPDHTYTKNGVYHICLTVSDSIAKCTATYCDSVTITNACSAHFVYAVSTGLTVGFSDSGSSAINDKHSATWTFGDGTKPLVTGDYTYHTYSKAGTYQVCVTVYDSVTKCSAQYCSNVNVIKCTLTPTFKYTRVGNKFTFSNSTTNLSAHTKYTWYFGDGAIDSSASSTVSHTYTATVATENVYLIIYDSVTGCTGASSQAITLCATKSDFTDKITVLSVAFVGDSSNSTTVTYSWDFGDNSTLGTGLRPSHAYAKGGNYQVCLTATDNATGCVSKTCNYVAVSSCNLTASFTDSLSGRTVYFKGKTNLTSKHSSIKWYFNDGTPDDSTSGLNTHHTFASSYSSVNVYLIIYDSTSKCQVYTVETITLCNAKSDYTYKVNGASVSFAVDSINNSTVRYSWNFGDKTTGSDSKKPTHTYTASGNYSVCLTATDSATGCTTTTCTNITISTCTLTASYKDSVIGNTVKFFGTSNASAHHRIIWIFGDNTTDSTSNSYDVSHTYGSSVSTASAYMRVYDSITKCYTYGTGTITLCTAQSNFTDKISGLTVAFGANTTNSTRIRYSWNFGDKSDSRLAAPTHTYSASGTYQVCLTATDSVTGCSTMTCNSVTVSTTCSLSVKITDSVLGHTVTFAAITNASKHSSIKWIFGDGVIDSTSGLYTSHSYGNSVVSENVYVRIYDSVTKCLAYGNITITLCTALSDYTYSVNGSSVSFKGDPNNGSTVKYEWNFGDSSTTGTTSDPTHNYTTAGTYYVCLSVINGNTCSSSTCKYITVTGCSLTASFTDSVSGHTVTFFGKSNLTSKHSSIKWSFGDGAIDSTTGFSATHTYASSAKSESATLRVYDSTTKCLKYYTTTISFCHLSAHWTYTFSGKTVKFIPDSTNPTSGVTYAWNFGDKSNYGTTKDPSHTYSNYGTYQVCMFASDSPCSAYYCDSIVIPAPTNTTYCISGTVMTGKVAAYPAKVFLVYYNSKDSTLDSIKTTQTNNKGKYEFCGLRSANYYIKAALDSNNSYYKYFIPTYHYDATKWTGANIITLSSANDTGENVIMKTGTNPGGAGFIGGKVSAGAGKTGDPVSGVEVVLYDSLGINPVAFTYTDASGYYSFAGIAFGTYQVFGEIVGKVCYPALVTITDTSSTDNTVDLQVKLTTITAAIKPAGVWTIEKADVYPNPVTNKLTLSMSIRNAGPATLKIYDLTGKVVTQVSTSFDAGAQKMEVDASSLPAGLYFLRMEMLKNNTLMEAQFVKVH